VNEPSSGDGFGSVGVGTSAKRSNGGLVEAAFFAVGVVELFVGVDGAAVVAGRVARLELSADATRFVAFSSSPPSSTSESLSNTDDADAEEVEDEADETSSLRKISFHNSLPRSLPPSVVSAVVLSW